MPEDLLQTKLYIPRLRPSLVPRPRLIKTLNQGLTGKLTLISAPAGFGKTTLISSWVDALQTERSAPSSAQLTWLSLDENDSELARFLAYVIAALQRVDPHIGESALPLLQASPLPVPSVLTSLLNDIAEQPDALMLVLDDYHAVDSRPIDEALTFLLDNLPPQLHLVITSREDPNLPLARLRVRGWLTELRAADLRFTVGETAVFLQEVMGLNLTEEQIAALETRTEGWIAGLQMAALSMRGENDLSGFIQSFTGSHRFVLDYLLEEVLQQQPEYVQEFLLKTAVLNQLTGPLCDALTGERDGQAVLESLEHANLFLVPLDNERCWYRYHHLFADLLRNRLAQGQPDLVPRLHQQASDWYIANGRPDDAVRHALAANDFERAARHIELARRTMDLTNRLEPWRQWIKALPESVVHLRPVLLVSYAWAHLIFDSERDACERYLQEAEQWLNMSEAERDELGMVVEDDEAFEKLPVSIASARTYAARAAGDLVGAVKHARQALDLLPEDDYLGRAFPESLLGLCYWANGELSSAYEEFDNSFNGFYRSGNVVAAISIKLVQTDIQLVQGRLHDARQTCKQALQLVSAQGDLNLRGTANLLLSLSELQREQGDSKTADDYLQQSTSLGNPASSFNYQYRKRVALAQIKASQGAFAEALGYLDEAASWLGEVHLREIRPLAAIKVQVWLKQGRLGEALAWVKQQGLSIDDELSFLHEFEHMTLARILIAQYRNGHADAAIHQALRLLARLFQAAEAGKRTGSIIKILILQALAQEAQNNISLALTPLTQALALAHPESHVRPFVDEGPPMAALLRAAVRQGISAEFAQQVLAALGETAVTPPPAQPLLDPLSDREIEVLQIIAEGLTNQEVANRLYLSLHTVKVHARNIYAKLDVKNRTEAVARGRSLGILPPT